MQRLMLQVKRRREARCLASGVASLLRDPAGPGDQLDVLASLTSFEDRPRGMTYGIVSLSRFARSCPLCRD